MEKSIKNLKIVYCLQEYETFEGRLLENPDELFDITEIIEIDREKCSLVLQSKTASVNRKKCEFQDIYMIGELLDDIGDVEDKFFPLPAPQSSEKTKKEWYDISIEYDDNSKRNIHGYYSRLNLPKNYLSIVEKIEDFIKEELQINIFISKWQYESQLLVPEYYCVGVTFDYSDKIYYYKTKMRLRVGQYVLVPVNKSEATAFVESVEILHKDSFPIPFEMVKEVISIIDEK